MSLDSQPKKKSSQILKELEKRVALSENRAQESRETSSKPTRTSAADSNSSSTN